MATMATTVTDSQTVYFAASRAAGMPADQVVRFASAGYVALKSMLPFHAAARLCDDRRSGVTEILLDGTRGSAKSHAVIAQVGLDDCQRTPGIKWLFLRQTERAAAESFEDLIARALRGIKHKANSERITFPNGSRILIGGYKDDSDINKYIGIEYDGIVLEEATQISGDKIEKLLGSVRTSRDGWVPRVYLTTNPGGIGHGFCKERYIVPYRQNRQTFTRRFYTSYKDNPFINPEYRLYLERLTGVLKKQWAEGDWDIFAGMAFANWRAEISGRPWHVIRPQEIPDYWIRKSGYDWGFAKPMSYLWGARNPDNGRYVIYRNLHGAGLTDPRQVAWVKESEVPGERIVKRYADPSIWIKKTQSDDPTSTAEVFASRGIYLTKAVNDRVAGKRKVDALLEPLPDGLPGILFFENCIDIIRTLPLLIYDETQPEDVDSAGDDHDYDALRYLLTDDVAQQVKTKQPRKPAPFVGVKGL